jgi:hypothetical protein
LRGGDTQRATWVGPYTQADELNATGEVLENHCGLTVVKNLLSWYGLDADYQALGEAAH